MRKSYKFSGAGTPGIAEQLASVLSSLSNRLNWSLFLGVFGKSLRIVMRLSVLILLSVPDLGSALTSRTNCNRELPFVVRYWIQGLTNLPMAVWLVVNMAGF